MLSVNVSLPLSIWYPVALATVAGIGAPSQAIMVCGPDVTANVPGPVTFHVPCTRLQPSEAVQLPSATKVTNGWTGPL